MANSRRLRVRKYAPGFRSLCLYISPFIPYRPLRIVTCWQNPEHLLVFAAMNAGGLKDIEGLDLDVDCTVGSPGTGKNVLAIGATSNGPSRKFQTD